MKTLIFTTVIVLSVLVTKGQQRLSYSYDGAGNRTSRTVVVGAQNLSADQQNEPSISYLDTLGGNAVLIASEGGALKLSIKAKSRFTKAKGKYSISGVNDEVLANGGFSAKATSVDLDDLPTGLYTFHIYINEHSSTWNLVKL